MSSAAIIPLSDGGRYRLRPLLAPTRACRQETMTNVPGFDERIFRDQPLTLHKRVVFLLYGARAESAELYRRLAPYDGQARDLNQHGFAVLGATCALAVRDLVDAELCDAAVWQQLERVARGGKLTGAEWRALAAATAHLEEHGYAAATVFRAARRLQTTCDRAVAALRQAGERERAVALVLEVAAQTSR